MDQKRDQKRAAFRALHEQGCFVIPNPWDIGSARILQSLHFKALATTSSGMAWAAGRPDYGVSCDQVLEHISILANAVDIPLNADFEDGFAEAPDAMAANVARAVETGVAGLSIEDWVGTTGTPLYDFDLSVSRIKAARAVIDRAGSGVLLTARCELALAEKADLTEIIRRLQAYAAAGADCLYAPGLRNLDQIAAVVAAVAPKPVNVLTPGFSLAEIAATGARRVSVGGSLARSAWGEVIRIAKEMAETGQFTGFARAASYAELNRLFSDNGTGISNTKQ